MKPFLTEPFSQLLMVRVHLLSYWHFQDQQKMMYTDLAVEIQEECSGRQGEIPGVVLEQYKEDGKGIRVTKIQIQTADGAKRMGRPIGNYMTLESADKEHSDKNLSETKLPDTNLLASYINGLLPSSAHSFLIVGLGNANMTADALGPLTIRKWLSQEWLHILQ